MAGINGKDYLFQDITWNSWYKTNQNWRENFNNFKNALAPYFELNYSIEPGLLIAETPFSFDATNKIMIQHPKTTLTVKRTGIYSVVSAWDEDNEKIYISFNDGELKTYKESAGFNWHVDQIGVGVSRFDLYLYDNNRVYVASDFENLIESEPSSKGKPYNEKGHSELKYPTPHRTGSGLGENMEYYLVDNFSFKKDGKIYNMQGWSTDNHPNDKGLTTTQIEDENVDPPYGYDIKGIESRQFNLGLYPKGVVYSEWEECPIDTRWDTLQGAFDYYSSKLKEGERLIAYRRSPAQYLVNIKQRNTSPFSESNSDVVYNWSLNYDITTSVKHASEISFFSKYSNITTDQKLRPYEEQYFSSIIEEKSVSNNKQILKTELDYSENWHTQKISRIINDKTFFKFPSFSFSFFSSEVDDFLNQKENRTIYFQRAHPYSVCFFDYLENEKENTNSKNIYPFFMNYCFKKAPVILSDGTYTSINFNINNKEYRVYENDLDNNKSYSEWDNSQFWNTSSGYSSPLVLEGSDRNYTPVFGSRFAWGADSTYYLSFFARLNNHLTKPEYNYALVLWSPYLDFSDHNLVATKDSSSSAIKLTLKNNGMYNLKIKFYPSGTTGTLGAKEFYINPQDLIEEQVERSSGGDAACFYYIDPVTKKEILLPFKTQ